MTTASKPVSRAVFWTATAVVAHTLWTSAAPSMSYPLYAATWNLSHAQTTAIFAVYPIVVAVVLAFFGDLPESWGRRRTILLGLAASLAGAVIFAIGPSLHWLLVARGVMAVGVGLTAAPASAAQGEYLRVSKSWNVGTATTSAQAAGLMSAILVGGALVQYAPFPLHLNYIVLALVIAAIMIAAWFLPPDPPLRHTPRSYFRWPSIPRKSVAVFVAATLSAAAAYAVSSLFFSLGAQIAKELVGSVNVFTNAAVLSVLPILMGATAILARHVSFRSNFIFGSIAAIIALCLLVLCSSNRSLALFLGSASLTGVACSMLLTGSLDLLARCSPNERLGTSMSALYLCAYVTVGFVALGLGEYATRSGLHSAIVAGAVGLSILAMTMLSLAVVLRTRFNENPPSEAARGFGCL